MQDEGLEVPVMVDGSKVDFAEDSPPSESSPTQKRDRLARALYDDWKRSRLQEEEEVLQTEEVHGEDEGWLPMREDVNETQDESEMDEDPPAAVPFECSPVPSRPISGVSDATSMYFLNFIFNTISHYHNTTNFFILSFIFRCHHF